MKQTYLLKKKPIPEDLKAADDAKRAKVEEVLNKKLNDHEWNNYKRLSRIRPKN